MWMTDNYSILQRLLKREMGYGNLPKFRSPSLWKPKLRSFRSAQVLGIEEVIELIPPVKDEVMLGFTRDGQYIISYKHDEEEYFLQLWDVNSLISKIPCSKPALRTKIFSHLPPPKLEGSMWQEPHITLWQLPGDQCLLLFAHHESGVLYVSVVPTIKEQDPTFFLDPMPLNFKLSTTEGVLPHPTCVGCRAATADENTSKYSFVFKTIGSIVVMHFSPARYKDCLSNGERTPPVAEVPGFQLCRAEAANAVKEEQSSTIQIHRIEGLYHGELETNLGQSISKIGVIGIHPDCKSVWLTLDCETDKQLPVQRTSPFNRTSWIHRPPTQIKAARTYTYKRTRSPVPSAFGGSQGSTTHAASLLQARWYFKDRALRTSPLPEGTEAKDEAIRLRRQVFLHTKPETLCRVADNLPLLQNQSLPQLVNPILPLLIRS
eukprot:gb/GECG01005888.1/.p1 GENE.gb/GECG01005888.1/~~gb/GECG01005888.1/.p1  ORF type:complete len:433 (+),score=25.49 gb/GECG01005888.1/:1-1299(+)